MNPFFPESSPQFASPLFFINLFIRNHMNAQYPMNHFFPNLPSNSHRHCFFWVTASSENQRKTKYPMNHLLPNHSFTSHRHCAFLLTSSIWKPKGNKLSHAPFTSQCSLHCTSPLLFINRFHLKPKETTYSMHPLLPNLSFTSHLNYFFLTSSI